MNREILSFEDPSIYCTLFTYFKDRSTCFKYYSTMSSRPDYSVNNCDNRPPSGWLRGAKPLGPFLGPLTSFPSV